MIYHIETPDDMIEIGTTLLSIGNKFLVQWILWAGKTHLCKWFAQALDIKPNIVHSPTYVYYHEYNNLLLHADFDRIKDPALFTLRGIDTIIEEYSYCFIERPNFSQYYADKTWHCINIQIDPNNSNLRIVTVAPYLWS